MCVGVDPIVVHSPCTYVYYAHGGLWEHAPTHASFLPIIHEGYVSPIESPRLGFGCVRSGGLLPAY